MKKSKNNVENTSCCLQEAVKGGEFIMERRIVMWIIIGLLFLAVLLVIFKAGSTGNIVAVQSAAPAVKSAASSAMVGGC